MYLAFNFLNTRLKCIKLKQWLPNVIELISTLSEGRNKSASVVELKSPWHSVQRHRKVRKDASLPSLQLHVMTFSIMLEEEGSTGYTGRIGCTGPRSFVPNHRTAAEEKQGENQFDTA